MPHLDFSRAALADLQRLRDFLRKKNPRAAKAAGETIIEAIKVLSTFPEAGRPSEGGNPDERELVIGHGRDGYIALYRFDGTAVRVLAIRHDREEGY
jgi:plasmid stabilization system protein ParE